MILKPINPENQITDALGLTTKSETAIEEKVRIVKQNLNKIVRINSHPVYHVEFDDNNGTPVICYFLSPLGDTDYYYPIEYAEIEIDTAEK